MNGSEERGELFAALAKAQGEFKPVEKTVTNTFFKTKYADLASVVSMAAPVLAKNGLAVVQTPEWSPDLNDTLLTTTLTHSSGQWVGSTMRLFLAKPDPQSQGSALTYGRRYAYCSMLSIVADDDDDGSAATQASQNGHAKKAAPATPAEPALKSGEVSAASAKRTLLAAFAAQGIGASSRSACARPSTAKASPNLCASASSWPAG